ncbi:unnamed protein product [Cyprideis torosa]|uniref:Uncharacterized protein n=1 Tax=Cyprideis torosa TaxID=163714 RepID=A0A7R8W6G4_9CRUS|nr:unnamed protein product [Cyprideis torosa]CAG0881745.1 unnamed protein product [Cyprideis torosa]
MDGAGNPNVPQGERPPTAPPVNWGRRRKKFGGNLGVLEKCISSPNMGAHATVAPSSGTAGVSVDNGENYAPEYADMEAWLDEHPEFTKDYFIRKASRQMVDLWLLTHAIPMTLPLEVSPAEPTLEEHVHVGMISGVGSAASLEEQEEESGGDALDQSDLPSSSVGGASSLGERKQGSGATTPVRKISATEFEKGGLLTPIVNTVDGCPTFISQPLPDMTSAQVQEGRMRRKSRAELKALDEKELIFELVKDICRDLDVVSLCHKILQNVGTLTNANRCSLFLVKGAGEEARELGRDVED